MQFPPYPAYKSSGLEWLDVVPEHWSVARSDGMISTEKRQLPPEAFAGQNVLHYSIPVVQLLGTGAVENGDEIASAKQVISAPAVLVSRLNPRKATICRAEPHDSYLTLASTEFVALKAAGGDLRFLEYLVCSELFRQRLDSWVQSVTRSHQRAQPEHIYRFWNAWPGPDEQHAIAEFLDGETGRIDSLVAKKRELIDRLMEKRAALISRTVTRGLPPDAARAAGLDPNPKLKPSGIDWLGSVPERWDVSRLKFCLSRIEQGWSPQCENSPADDDEWGVLKVGAVNNWTFNSFENKRLPDNESPVSEYEISVGDFLVSRANTRQLLGSAALVHSVRPRLLLCDKLYRLVVKRNRLAPEFLLYFLRSVPGHFVLERDATGASDSMQNISQGAIKTLWLPVPPVAEQRAIANYLDREGTKIDFLATKAEEATERLLEYRSALITAAVTGKIDVRRVHDTPTESGGTLQP